MRTTFYQNEHGGEWFWHTHANNGKVVADGSEGYDQLGGAIHGFLVAHELPAEQENQDAIYRELLGNREDYMLDGYPSFKYNLLHNSPAMIELSINKNEEQN